MSTLYVSARVFVRLLSFLKHSVFHVAFVLVLGGCSWSSPFPRATVNIDGLGQGVIADYLAGSWMNSEKWLAKRIREMLIATDTKIGARSRAELIGMKCDPLPAKTCRYQGVVRYMSEEVSPETSRRSRTKTINVSALLSDYDNTDSIAVTKTVSIID